MRSEERLELDLTKTQDPGHRTPTKSGTVKMFFIQLRCQALPAYRQAKTATMKSTPKQEKKRKKKLTLSYQSTIPEKCHLLTR